MISSKFHRRRRTLTVQVNVDTVQSDQEVGKNVLLGLWDVGKEGADESRSVGELSISYAPP